MAEASDFKFGTQLEFTKKGHHEITPIGKSGHGLKLGKLPKISWSHFDIYIMAEARTSNLVHSLGLPTPTIKPHPEEKWAWPWFREAPIHLVFPFNISATASLSS